MFNTYEGRQIKEIQDQNRNFAKLLIQLSYERLLGNVNEGTKHGNTRYRI